MNDKATLRAAFKAKRDSLQGLPGALELRARLATNLARALDVAPSFLRAHSPARACEQQTAQQTARPTAHRSERPLEAPRAPRIASYLPIGSEFDPNDTVREDWLFPRVRPGGRLAWFRWGDESIRSRLVRNKYGILEAPDEDCFECDATPEAPWIAIVPALACDASHARLGYGGGFYDRFLANPGGGKRPGIFTICAVPEEFSVEALPHEPWDVPVDMVVTEKRVCVLS